MPVLVLGTTQAHAVELFHDDFESGSDLFNPLPSGYGWNGAWSDPGDAIGVSTGVAHSGTRSVKFTFGGGADSDDARSELRYILGQNMTEVYMQWYQYYPSGNENPSVGPKWVHRTAPTGGNNNKFYKLWDDDYQHYKVATGVSTHPGANLHDKYFVEYGSNLLGFVGEWGGHGDYTVDDSYLGRWTKIQIHTRCATAANNDGVIEMWIDDVRVMGDTTLDLYPIDGIGNYLRNGYLMGWSNSGFAQTTHTYIDDVTIADAPIDASPASKPKAPVNLQVQ